MQTCAQQVRRFNDMTVIQWYFTRVLTQLLRLKRSGGDTYASSTDSVIKWLPVISSGFVTSPIFQRIEKTFVQSDFLKVGSWFFDIGRCMCTIGVVTLK